MGVTTAESRRPSSAATAPRSVFGSTRTLLGLAGVISLLFAALIVTGWLPLGERANISRADLNPGELLVMIGMAAWGLLCFITLAASGKSTAQISAYFSDARGGISLPLLFTLLALLITGGVCLLVVEQLLTGWLALGERANISRRDINWIEIVAAIGAAFWGVVNLRTAWAIVVRDKAAPAWSQWVLLISGLFGIVFVLSAAFDTSAVTLPLIPGADTDASLRVLQVIGFLVEMFGAGLIVIFSSLAAYQLIGATRTTRADQAVRNVLSKIPGAGAIVGFIAIFIFFSVASDLFLEPRALAGALTTNITRGIVAIGITLLMISGEFDLSVGSQLNSIGLIFLLAMTEGVLGLPPMHILPAMVVAFAFAAVLGLINGFILIRTGIPSFIVTLGTLLAYRAIPLVIVSEGRILRYADYRLPPPTITLSNLVVIGLLALLLLGVAVAAARLIPQQWASLRARIARYGTDTNDFRDFALFTNGLVLALTAIATGGAAFLLGGGILSVLPQAAALIDVNMFDLLNGQFWFLGADVNLRTGVLWWFLLVLFFQFILTQTRYGSYVFAVGGNPGAARAQGISVNGVKVLNFVICSWMVAAAAVMDIARVQSIDSTRGDGLELEVIAASVIGGTLLTGGYGSIFAALLGVFIFGMLRTGLVLIGLNPRIFNGVIGVIIVVAVVINTWVRQERR
ncbi:MAG: ABC transporter permease [bacterium]|nr:ABC transporter permease [bacterium]